MFLEDIDFSKPIPQPQLFICKNNLERTIIANLSEAFNIELNLKFGGISELNFSVPFEIDSNNELIKNPNINKLLYKYIIKIILGSYEDYFIIDKPKDNMSDSEDTKNVTCYSISYELKDKNIRYYVVEAKSINQLFNGFTEDEVIYPSILSETNWTLGYVDVDAQILYRGFSVSSKTLLDFLFEIAETFNCIIIFDNKNKIINFYDPLKLGTYKGLSFSYGRYLQNLDYEPDYDNVCTRLKLFGKDDITINEYNSTGTNYLENISYFLYPFERKSLISDDKIKSGNLYIWDMTDIDKILSDISTLGLNTVNVPIKINIENINSNIMSIDTTSKLLAMEIINELNKNNINVILEPHPFVSDGTISETEINPSDINMWFYNWKTIILETLINDIANPLNVWAINVSSNLVKLEYAEGYWIDVINFVKNIYNGNVTYRTNWWVTAIWLQETIDDYQLKLNRSFWEYVDFISISAYFELNEIAVPTVEQCKSDLLNSSIYNRGQNIYQEIKNFNIIWNKPVFFGELGVPNKEYASFQPWNNLVSTTISNIAQNNVLQAYKEIFENEEWFYGFSIFIIGYSDSFYNIINNIAQNTIKYWWFDGYDIIQQSNYLSYSLCNSLLDYQELINSNDNQFTILIGQKEIKQEGLIVLENSLIELQSGENGLNIIQDSIDITQSNNNYYNNEVTYYANSLVLYNNIPYKCIQESIGNLPTNTIYWDNLLTLKQNKELEIDNKELEIDNKELEIDNINLQITALKNTLSIESNFTLEQITELNNYIIVKELSNDKISNAKDLIEFGKKEFTKIITPVLNIKISTVNLLSLLEEQDKWDKFLPTNLGDIVKIYYDKMNIEVEAKIIEFNFNFEEKKCTLSISNSKEISDDKQKFLKDLNKAISTSTTVDMNKYNISGIPQLTSEINQIINNKWDANKNAITAGTNENYSLDRHGLTLKSPTDQLNFLRGLHNILAFTNDGGNTYKNALTPEGLVAEVIWGKLLCGVNLQIDASDTQGNKTFIVNQDKVEISGLALQITNGGIPQGQLSPATQSLITNAVQIDTLAPDLTTPTMSKNLNGTVSILINKPTTSGSNTINNTDDLAGFNIWRGTINNPSNTTLIKSLTTTNTTCPDVLTYTDDSVNIGTTYYYWVSVYDTQGNETDKIQVQTIDSQISITPLDILPPSAPSNLIIKGGWGRIDLSWDAPTDKDILKYKIRISDNSNFSSYTDVYTFTTKYTDFDRTTINTRYYRVYTIDKAGNKSWNETTVPSSGYIEDNGKAITPGDNEAPHSVTSGTLTSDSNGNFILTFIGSDSPDVSLYRIVRHTCTDFIASNDDGGIDVGIINHLGVGQHKFIDKNLEKNKYYYYKVYTIDNSGMISTPLTILSITQDGIVYPIANKAIDTTPPNIPEYLSLEAKIGGITVSWPAVNEAVSYNVFRYDSDGNNELFMGNVTQLQFTDNSMLTNYAQMYQYKVSAIDSWGNESAKSDTSGNEQSLTPFTANDTTAPFIGIFNDPVVNNDGSITLSWSGFSDLESGVGGYNIWRILSTQTFNDKVLLKSINNKNITSYIDINTIHNTVYKYTITCFDGAGNESAIETNLTNWKQATAFDTVAPDAPIEFVAFGGLGSIVLTWTAPNNTDINKYKILASDTNTDTAFNACTPIYTILTTYTDSSIMSLNPRYYRIYAIDNAGLISSNYLSGSGICAIPGDGVAPTSLPTIDNVNSKSNYDGSISVVWNHVNPDGDLSKYRIYRSESNIQNPDPIPIYINIGEVQKDTKIYHDTGLKNGIYYKYKLSSVDYSGMEYSGTEVITSNITNWLLATDDSAPIITNVNLIAEEDLGAIKLKWTEVSEKGVTYEIYRCNGEDAEWDGLNNLPVKIATVAGSTSGNGQQGMYTDYDPPVGTATTYTYALKVVDAWGNFSGFTNHATATSINNFTGTLNGIGESTLTNGIKIDSTNGLVITRSNIDNTIVYGKSVFNATDGIKISKTTDNGGTWLDQLKIDTDGNLLLSGKIQIGDTFSVSPTGILSATGATIAGNVDITGTLKINGTNILDAIDGKITSAGLNSTVNSDINKGVTARSYFDSNGNLIMSHLASITWDKIDTTGATASDVGAVANNQSAVFNTLTNNGNLQGLFMSGGQLYVNASYINAGVLQGLTVRTGVTGSTRVELKSGWADIDIYNGSNNIFKIEDQLLSVVIYNPLGYGMTIGKAGQGDIVCNGTWDFTDATVNGVVAVLG